MSPQRREKTVKSAQGKTVQERKKSKPNEACLHVQGRRGEKGKTKKGGACKRGLGVDHFETLCLVFCVEEKRGRFK